MMIVESTYYGDGTGCCQLLYQELCFAVTEEEFDIVLTMVDHNIISMETTSYLLILFVAV